MTYFLFLFNIQLICLLGVPKALQRAVVICGNRPSYYPHQRDCWDYFDPAAIPPILGGCHYDMGLGSCIEKDVHDLSLGCANQMENYMVALISPHATMLVMATTFNIIAMLVSCCMFWKRKEQDVFPAFKNPVVPVSEEYIIFIVYTLR